MENIQTNRNRKISNQIKNTALDIEYQFACDNSFRNIVMLKIRDPSLKKIKVIRSELLNLNALHIIGSCYFMKECK